MKYKLVTGGINQLSKIEAEVNNLTNLGWEVVGELKTAAAEGQTVFVQQMNYVGVAANEPKKLPDVQKQRHTRPSPLQSSSPYIPRLTPYRRGDWRW